MKRDEIDYFLKEIQKNNFSFFDLLQPREIVKFLKLADQIYYNSFQIFDKHTTDFFQFVMTDINYDKIVNILQEKDPENEYLLKIGAEIQKNASERMIQLPFPMASLDKFKNNDDRWLKKLKNVMISDKIDGVSFGILKDNDKIQLFTRGNGKIGQDVSFLIDYIPNLNNLKRSKHNFQIRGELVMKNNIFNTKYKDKFSNPRNLVSGILNKCEISPIFNDVIFLGYSVISPKIKLEETFNFLSENGINIPFWKILKSEINIQTIQDIFINRKKDVEYNIDGLVITDLDKEEDTLEKNPKNTKAFKMNLNVDSKIAEVEEIIWKVGKTGTITPKIRIKPININGVNINFVTAHNAKYVVDNKLGVGSQIEIVRSGDVIPYIVNVITHSEESNLPRNIKYIWNGVHICLNKNQSQSEQILLQFQCQKILAFFKVLNIHGISIGLIEKLLDSGYNTLFDILKMSKNDFLNLPGFQEKLSEKIYNNIQLALSHVTMVDLLYSSNCFPRTMGTRRFKLIVDNIPNFLEISKTKLKNEIINLPGFNIRTAEDFIVGLDDFRLFLKEFLEISEVQKEKNETALMSLKFKGMSFVFSGCRSKECEEYITQNGGSISNTISKSTSYLIVKDINNESSKIKKAKSLCKEIILLSDFYKQEEIGEK